MNYILTLLIFSGVIAAGNALCCKTCEAEGKRENNCEGEEEECENETDFCIKQIKQTILRGNLKTTIKKCCMKAENRKWCDRRLILNTTVLDSVVYSECCFDKDGCNSGEIEIPESDHTPNGVQCEACFVKGSDECKDIILKKCVGDQRHCFSLKGKVFLSGEGFKKYLFKGCVTEDTCTFNLHDLPKSRLGDDATYSCTSPSE